MRIFTEPSAVEDAVIRITDRNDIHHMTKVMRLKAGDLVEVSDASAFEYQTEILSIGDEEVVLSILDKQKFAREPDIAVTLFQGVPKAGKMETVIQKCVELGVYSIVPVFTDRSVVVEKGNFSKKLARWQKIADEAVKQCKRGRIPQIAPQLQFSEIAEKLSDFDLVIFPYENEMNYSIKDCLRGLSQKPGTIAVVIGPEGGFSDSEAKKMAEIGASQVTLGKTVLRTETAGMAALAMIMYELEL